MTDILSLPNELREQIFFEVGSSYKLWAFLFNRATYPSANRVMYRHIKIVAWKKEDWDLRHCHAISDAVLKMRLQSTFARFRIFLQIVQLAENGPRFADTRSLDIRMCEDPPTRWGVDFFAINQGLSWCGDHAWSSILETVLSNMPSLQSLSFDYHRGSPATRFELKARGLRHLNVRTLHTVPPDWGIGPFLRIENEIMQPNLTTLGLCDAQISFSNLSVFANIRRLELDDQMTITSEGTHLELDDFLDQIPGFKQLQEVQIRFKHGYYPIRTLMSLIRSLTHAKDTLSSLSILGDTVDTEEDVRPLDFTAYTKLQYLSLPAKASVMDICRTGLALCQPLEHVEFIITKFSTEDAASLQRFLIPNKTLCHRAVFKVNRDFMSSMRCYDRDAFTVKTLPRKRKGEYREMLKNGRKIWKPKTAYSETVAALAGLKRKGLPGSLFGAHPEPFDGVIVDTMGISNVIEEEERWAATQKSKRR